MQRRILVVEPDAGYAEFVRATLTEHDVHVVETAALATHALAELAFDVVLTAQRLPDSTGTALLTRIRDTYPTIARVLSANAEDLPVLIQEGADQSASFVLPRTRGERGLRKAVAKALLLATPSASIAAEEARPLDWDELDTLTRALVRGTASISSRVVRALPKDPNLAQMQIVVPIGPELDRFVASLPRMWGAPREDWRARVTERVLRKLQPGQSLFVRKLNGVRDDDAYAYLALLPWRKKSRATLVLGIDAGVPTPRYRELMDVLRKASLDELSELVLPPRGEGDPVLRYLPDYDWVATKNYVGPDRRGKPTGFASRYVFLGRRRELPRELRDTAGAFIDRMTPGVVGLLFAYVLLSSIDTWMTFIHAGSGAVYELNPILRPLLAHPWAFLIFKTTIAIVAFLAVARFELFGFGRWLLMFVVSAYALLDIYWLVLQVEGRLRGSP